MPQASSLFKAIINNKTEDASVNAQLENILSSNENVFTAKTSVKNVEEEPELFTNHNPKPFTHKSIEEEQEKLIVSDEDEEYTPTLIERVTGFSIAKRNRKKLKESEQAQEQIAPSFSEDNENDDRMNLEIPSFLRRR